MDITLGVIGKGFVGTALVEGMRHAFKMLVYDKKRGLEGVRTNLYEYVNGTPTDVVQVVQRCPVIFVCVPTPMRANGSCDTSIVEGVVEEIYQTAKDLARDTTIVIKSTVVPGTTRRLNEKYKKKYNHHPNIQCVFNPEFLREATYIEDFKNQDRIIIGGPRPGSNVVKDIYQHAYPDVPTIKTCETTAEMVKYLTNCFLSVKVAFANEVAQLCDKLAIDYDKVVEYATRDARLGTSHWSVPGPDGEKGFGGKCFPKDLNALMHLAYELSVKANVMSAAWTTNLEVREDKDWERIEGATS